MTMVALNPIPKGQQIFNDFGQLPRFFFTYKYNSERFLSDHYLISRLTYSLSLSSDSKSISMTAC